MKKQILVCGSLILLVIAILVWRHLGGTAHQASEEKPPATFSENSPPASRSTVPVGENTLGHSVNKKGKDWEDFAAELKKRGFHEIPSVGKFLEDEVKSGDNVRILRAFHQAIYSREWSMSEAIPAIKAFLNDPNPYVRLNAAQVLLVAGDQSGHDTLLALVQANSVMPGLDGQDMRINAATSLAQFRQSDAMQAIYDLYQQTKNGELIVALQKLAPDQVGQLIPPKDYYADPLAIRDYGLEKDVAFLPQITATFQKGSEPDVTIAAAWALATMTGDQSAIDYLLQTAQYAINAKEGIAGTVAPGQPNFSSGEQALKYLGSIQNPQAKKTLEAALDSAIPSVVQTAVANLLFNQGGSEKAIQVIADQLNDSSHAKLPWEFTYNVAAQFADNPAIQAAGKKFAQHDATEDWQLYTVERKNWPIYNWIDNYVVKLNSR